MKHRFLTGLALISALLLTSAAAAAAEACGCQGNPKSSCECKGRSSSACDCKAEAKALYRCPMHPEVTSEKPDQICPKCEMPLEKVVDEAPDADKSKQESAEHEQHKH